MSLIDDKWRILFDKYRIEREIENMGGFTSPLTRSAEVKDRV